MKLYNFFFIAALMILTTGCSQNDEPKIDEVRTDENPTSEETISKEDLEKSLKSYSALSLSEEEKAWTEGSIDFSWRLMAEHSSLNPHKNSAISPLSASLALSMASAGALGETQTQMQEVLGQNALTQSKSQTATKRLIAELTSRDEITKVALANSFWHQPTLHVKKSYKDIISENFLSDVFEINASTFIKDANDWCSSKTNGQIVDFVKKGQSSSWVILNATYFKGIWRNLYAFPEKATKNEQFTNINGSSSIVAMMHAEKSYPYTKTDFAESVAIPFGNGAYSMTFILPNVDTSVDQCLEKLAVGEWKQAIPDYNSEKLVNISVPRFKVESNGSLSDELENMGMHLAFSDGADFSGISETHTSIGNVIQGVKLTIDEKGAMGAAVTEILSLGALDGEMEPITLNFNRPFIFCIAERSTGCVLFAGKIVNL